LEVRVKGFERVQGLGFGVWGLGSPVVDGEDGLLRGDVVEGDELGLVLLVVQYSVALREGTALDILHFRV
jgi:hypothetical protein